MKKPKTGRDVTPPKRSRELFSRWLGRTARCWRAEINRRLSPHRLSDAGWLVLSHLARAETPLTQKELAQRVGVTGPTLSTGMWDCASGCVARR